MTFDEAKALIDYALNRINGDIWVFILLVIFGLFGLGMAEDLRRRK